jgi:hypothetical protein
MMNRYFVSVTVLVGCLALAPAALAQGTSSGQPGSTSGPAVGTNVQPSTAAQKDNDKAQGTAGQSQGGSVAAGAPGATAKPGTEAGPAPARAPSK